MRGKVFYILLIIAAILVIVLVGVNLNKNKGQQSGQNTTNNVASGVTTKDVTQTKQGDSEISGVIITSDGNSTTAQATVKNNSSKKYSIVDISVIFYDNNKNVLATTKGLIENLAAGESKGFVASVSGDYSKSTTYEVKIDSAQ